MVALNLGGITHRTVINSQYGYDDKVRKQFHDRLMPVCVHDLHYEAIQKPLVLEAVSKIYPFLKSELFLSFSYEELQDRVNHIITEFERQEVIKCNANMLSINKPRVRMLQLWSSGVREILQRYYITVSILEKDPATPRASLEKDSQSVAQRLSVLHGINAPEFFDKAVFSAFIASLKQEGYFNEEGIANTEKLNEITEILNQVISTEVCLTIKGAIAKIEEE